MRIFMFVVMTMLAFKAFAEQPNREVLVYPGEVNLGREVCASVRVATKAIVRNVLGNYDETIKVRPVDIGNSFARVSIMPIAMLSLDEQTDGVNLNVMRTSLFIRKHMATILGDTTTYREQKLKASDIVLKVSDNLNAVCNEHRTFHSETLYVF